MKMNEFKNGSDVALASIGSAGSSRDPTWTSQGIHLSSSHPGSHSPLSYIAYLLLHIRLDNLGTYAMLKTNGTPSNELVSDPSIPFLSHLIS